MYVNRKRFEELVAEALDGLPGEFAGALENLHVVVEEEPTDEELASLGLDPREDTLFGLYQGVSLPERGLDYSGLPDRIVIYRRPIVEACRSREEIIEEIRVTVLHEVGHYFGLGEEDVPP